MGYEDLRLSREFTQLPPRKIERNKAVLVKLIFEAVSILILVGLCLAPVLAVPEIRDNYLGPFLLLGIIPAAAIYFTEVFRPSRCWEDERLTLQHGPAVIAKIVDRQWRGLRLRRYRYLVSYRSGEEDFENVPCAWIAELVHSAYRGNIRRHYPFILIFVHPTSPRKFVIYELSNFKIVLQPDAEK